MVAHPQHLWQDAGNTKVFRKGGHMSEFAQARVAMVDCQVRPSDVTRYPIIEAMLSIPREDFVPASMRQVAYADAEIALSDDRVLLEPRTFAKMCDSLAVRGDELVLCRGGCGCGR